MVYINILDPINPKRAVFVRGCHNYLSCAKNDTRHEHYYRDDTLILVKEKIPAEECIETDDLFQG